MGSVFGSGSPVETSGGLRPGTGSDSEQQKTCNQLFHVGNRFKF
jgi:hypothetical protein